jgi:hypothetical protein
MKKAVLFGVLLLLALSAVATQCGGDNAGSDSSKNDTDNDGADDDSEKDDDSGDDDQLDDDIFDDDTADDDNSDDDTTGPHPPILTDVHFDPPYAELVYISLDDEYWYVSTIYLDVCDLGNDLLPEGSLLYYGPCEIGFGPPPPLYFSYLEQYADGDLSQAGDCAKPITIGLQYGFGPEIDPYGGCPEGELCFDFYGRDTAGYVSGQTEACIMYDPV